MLPNFHAPKSGACQNEVYPASELELYRMSQSIMYSTGP